MAGLAVASSRLCEIENIIEKFNNGVFFDPSSPKSIARVLNELIKNRQKLLKMKRNSLEAAKVFNWENEGKKLIGLYQNILKK